MLNPPSHRLARSVLIKATVFTTADHSVPAGWELITAFPGTSRRATINLSLQEMDPHPQLTVIQIVINENEPASLLSFRFNLVPVRTRVLQRFALPGVQRLLRI
jgi:hypothetical protein